MINEIWSKLTSISNEAMAIATAKALELGFDPMRGVVPLDESLANLASARDLLKEAVERQKLIQLPITVQKEIYTTLEKISQALTGLANGTDEIPNLAAEIEKLNTQLWTFRLNDLSPEVLGYQTKLNQLKSLELEVGRLKRELEQALASESQLKKLLVDAETGAAAVSERAKTAEEEAKKMSTSVDEIVALEANAKTGFASITANQTSSATALATANSAASEADRRAEEVKKFCDQIDAAQRAIDAVKTSAETATQQNSSDTKALIVKLGEIEDRIKVQIEKATGFSLFHSFQTRQESLAGSKKVWMGALGLLVVASVGLTIYIASTYKAVDAAFYLKLSASLPLIFAISFCSIQYSRERRLEEEYAFKSNISISLVPYKELVEKMVDSNVAGEKEKFSAFIIESVTKVFTSPTDKIFDSASKGAPEISEKTLRQLNVLAKTIAKGIK